MSPARQPLQLRPFRGMRYNAARVGDLAAVTSPPYDSMDRAQIDAALEAHRLNIVRLILPRLLSDPNQPNPYARAASLLQRWRTRSVLITDPNPGLYVYEYGDGDRVVCGLMGALALASPRQRVILPHEDVRPWVVADRLAMLAAMGANLEPLLLVYEGDPAVAATVEETMLGEPLIDMATTDGGTHRVWSITDPPTLGAVTEALEKHEALIADGHHRFATYRKLRKRRRQAGDGVGPWDYGLALLIDQSRSPLTLEAIHRTLDDVSLEELVAPHGFLITDPRPIDRSQPIESLAPRAVGTIALTDGRRVRRLTRDGEHGTGLSDVDVLNAELLPAWGMGDARVSFHHRVEQALDAARFDAGVAILLAPPSIEQTISIAREGRTLPRKSTSFGPKPRMGILMRHFDDQR
jgi:uncharacterized protein (DUF1015 family)